MKRDKNQGLKAISLFASGGIGDLALEENGISVLLANELLPDRASVFKHNFPDCKVIVGDIWEKKHEIIKTTLDMLKGQELDFILATPPCQGMSKNGQGKLLKGIRDNIRPKIDPRNRLIVPTLEIVLALRPKTVIFENVPEMQNTVIDDENGNFINIVDYIKSKLTPDYQGKAEVVAFADYGVPQRRSRLITVFTRVENLVTRLRNKGTLLPAKSHAYQGQGGLKPWVTVRDMIFDLPPLDSRDKKSATSNIQFHNVPVLDSKKYFWISNTPPEKGAFDNQCINPKCLYDKNLIHGATKNKDGINRANDSTPIKCSKCGELLPRPYVVVNNEYRIMSGYTSAYKRMSWDLPAPTLTTNMCYPSSDHKIHPEQHRVLSLYEAFRLHTLNLYDFEWTHENGDVAKDTLIREIIGESIPPKGISIIIAQLLQWAQEECSPQTQEQLSLTY